MNKKYKKTRKVLIMRQKINMKKELIFLFFIIILGLLTRIKNINYDLPYINHSDEPNYIKIAQNIFKSGDLNPHFFNYPSLFFYINASAYIPYYLFMRVLGKIKEKKEILNPVSLIMGTTKSPQPSNVILGRLITVLFGIGTIIIAFYIGKLLFEKIEIGILSAFFVSISPVNIIHSRYITPDTFVTFFAAATFLFAVLIFKKGYFWYYFFAGLFAGFTVSSKYNGGLVIITIVIAHFFYTKSFFKNISNLIMALEMCFLGFVITTPFAIFDTHKFLHDVLYESRHYSTGHAGMEGNVFQFYIGHMQQTMPIIYILALIEILRGFVIKKKETIFLSIFPIVYFIFICNFVVRNDRTFLPITIYLFILAASFFIYLKTKIDEVKNDKYIYFLFLIFLFIISLITPAKKINNVYKNEENFKIKHELVREWIDNNIPQNSKIAVESYTPFLDAERFSIIAMAKLIDKPINWYFENNIEYLIFSRAMFGRFFRDKNKYKNEVNKYEEMFKKFILLKDFKNEGIKIYKIK